MRSSLQYSKTPRNSLFLIAFLFCGAALADEKATFAGGCFWCMEPPFEKLEGVKAAVSGYAGGTEKNPTYEQVSAGKTGHAESVQVTFDPKKVSYDKLLDTYWRSMDPTDAGGQFVDRGKQYRPVIFYHSDSQKKSAETSKAALEKSGRYKGKKIVVEIVKATEFYPAEDYHQDYYKKSPESYHAYRSRSGRDEFLNGVWAPK